MDAMKLIWLLVGVDPRHSPRPASANIKPSGCCAASRHTSRHKSRRIQPVQSLDASRSSSCDSTRQLATKTPGLTTKPTKPTKTNKNQQTLEWAGPQGTPGDEELPPQPILPLMATTTGSDESLRWGGGEDGVAFPTSQATIQPVWKLPIGAILLSGPVQQKLMQAFSGK